MSIAMHAALGARPLEPGLAEFHVWAPRARSVTVLLGGAQHALSEVGEGLWGGSVPAGSGDDYRFVLDDG